MCVPKRKQNEGGRGRRCGCVNADLVDIDEAVTVDVKGAQDGLRHRREGLEVDLGGGGVQVVGGDGGGDGLKRDRVVHLTM
jgi:hypothetical protein